MLTRDTQNHRFLSIALAGLTASIVMVVAALAQAVSNVQAFV
jgi:hypothetical protein